MSNQSHSNNGKKNSEDDDIIERNNKGEEAASPIPTSASPYVYIDHSQERSEPLWFDQRFENLFQTADQKRKLPAKLNAMLSDPELSNIITWLPHGRSWRIIDRHNFINLVLPAYFDHNKFTSFIRLVNAWGFRRIPSGVDRDSYYHELFLRGMPHLHLRMRRLVSHESKAPVHDENRFPNFYEMPLLDEVSNGSAPFLQRQNSASNDSISSINGRACPQSNPSMSEGNSSASTSTASAILSTRLPADQIQNQRQAVNSLGMARQAQQQLMSNSNNQAFHLPPGGNPMMQRNLRNALIAAQPYYASLAQSKYHQLPHQHQQQQGQQMNDSQSATNLGHHPYQANGSIDPAHEAIAAATNHVQLVHQQQPPTGSVPSVFVSGGGSNAFNNLDQVIPGTTQQQQQQQQILQVQLQQNLSSASSNQQMITRQLFMQALNQHHQQEFDEAPSVARGPHLSLSASQEQLNSSRSSAIVQAQPSSTVPTFLQGGISNSNGQEAADYRGFITESNDCFTSRDSSTENSLSILSPLARANSTVALNNAKRSNDGEAPDTSSNGNGSQLEGRWHR